MVISPQETVTGGGGVALGIGSAVGIGVALAIGLGEATVVVADDALATFSGVSVCCGCADGLVLAAGEGVVMGVWLGTACLVNEDAVWLSDVALAGSILGEASACRQAQVNANTKNRKANI
jgi:hypothetical protein